MLQRRAVVYPAGIGAAAMVAVAVATAWGADVVPSVIEQPGTQPGEVGNLESPDKCDNCHGGYNRAVEPAFNWRGSLMGNAGRDPLFWATLAVAEQDFDGAGDLCIRCHSTGGWQAGRSTPTDGSGLMAADDDGVDCDTCHKMTNPDDSDAVLRGVMVPPYVANDGTEGYYGSGMLSLWGGAEKLGPYGDTAARHQFAQSAFHRSIDFCGSCHDVSNPAVGNLAPNHGAPPTGDPVTADGLLGGPVDTKAAFNNPPYRFGVVERTFSEFKSGLLSRTRVRDYWNLPSDLQAGALTAAYESALAAGTDGDYADGTFRYYSCQTCHLRAVTGPGCNKAGAPVRTDLPLHDMTGGNYWVADAIIHQDQQGTLRLGGGLTAEQIDALRDGQVRAMKQLSQAATLQVIGDTVKVVNLTGHKLITGYPEGRRMWLNIRWYDAEGVLVREDGRYGRIGVVVNGIEIESLLDLHDPNTTIFEAHYGMTQEWAARLRSLGSDPTLPLSFDRMTGAVTATLDDLATAAPGTEHETFHFVLNNTVVKDNRIPPYGMSYDEARRRNALPVPASQFGDPGAGGTYQYWHTVPLALPVGAVYAEIDLKYQPTSWEYIQFLALANNGLNAFLGQEGATLLDAWLLTGMAAPYTMVSTTWGSAPTPATPRMGIASLATWSVDNRGTLGVPASTFKTRETVAIVALVEDEALSRLSGAQVFMAITAPDGSIATTLQEFSDASGQAVLQWKTSRREPPGLYTATVTSVIKNGYLYVPAATTVTFTLE